MNTAVEKTSQLRVLRIVMMAMIGGLVIATGAAAWLAEPIGMDETTLLYLQLVPALAGLAMLAAYATIRHTLLARARAAAREGQYEGYGARRPAPQVVATFTTATLIGAALTEGFGLLGAMFYLMTRANAGLVAAAAAAVLLLFQMPTPERLRHWSDVAAGRR